MAARGPDPRKFQREPRVRKIIALCLPVCFLWAAAGFASPPHAPGLGVENGRLVREGLPYRGVGANYFDVFLRLINDDDSSGLDEMRRLAEAGIPFIRFCAGPYHPADWKLYRNDEKTYFTRFDRLVRAAEECGICLIPSLAWSRFAVPDFVGDPVGAWGDPASATWTFFRDYVRKVVGRYRDSPALWAWEFGNEYNLAVDLPNAEEHRGPTGGRSGYPAARTKADELSSDQIATALREFAKTVRAVDARRVIFSGHSKPRPSAWHQRAARSWEKDSREQFAEILSAENPDQLGTVSIHYYDGADGSKLGGDWAVDRSDYLGEVVRSARSRNAPVWIGEFGVEGNEDIERVRRDFADILDAMYRTGVDLATFWVFDLPSQKNTWNVTFDNDRSFMIGLAAEANRRWVQSAGAVPVDEAPDAAQ